METVIENSAILSIIEKVAKNENIASFALKQVTRNAKGEGYMGEVYTVSLQDKNSDRCLNLVIKAAYKDAKVREMAPVRIAFETESYFYTTIVPKYHELMRTRGFAHDEFVFSPKCLDYSLSDSSELLVLDNLKSRGFSVFDKHQVLNGDHVALIFATYGKFHALSFALKDQECETYNEFCSHLPNFFDAILVQMAMILKSTSEVAREALIDGEDDPELIRIFDENYRGDAIVEAYIKSTNDESRYPAIIHGDCWSNNMMFKYDGDTGSPSDMRLLDFQVMKQGSPACDLAYCLYSGGSREIFDDLDRYLKIYHDSFSLFLRKLGSDPEKLFPFEALKSEWKIYAKFGFFLALCIVKAKHTEAEDAIDFTDVPDDMDFGDMFAKSKFDSDGFKRRIKEIVVHLYEIGAL